MVNSKGQLLEQATYQRSGAWLLLLALFTALLGSFAPDTGGLGRAELRQGSFELTLGSEASGNRSDDGRADPSSGDPPGIPAVAAPAAAPGWHLLLTAQRLPAVPAATPISIGHAFEARGPPRS